MYRILAHARPLIAGRIQEKNESSHHDKWMNEWMLMSKRAIKASFKNRKTSRKITPNFKQIERISSLQKRWYTFFEKQMTVYITWWQVTKLQERVKTSGKVKISVKFQERVKGWTFNKGWKTLVEVGKQFTFEKVLTLWKMTKPLAKNVCDISKTLKNLSRD